MEVNPIDELNLVVELNTQKRVAESLGVTQQYISAVLKGKRKPGRKILNLLGLKRSVIYVRANGKTRGRNGRG